MLISGTTPYTIEEIDTAVRYVVPADQTAPVKWQEVTTRSFSNILKKFTVTVTKSDGETGTAQGDASLAGACYGLYKGNQLVASYFTDENGQFTSGEFVCGDDWSIREISPSEGYLLDSASYHVGAEAVNYLIEHNQTSVDVTEQVMKGNVAIIKHTDNGDTQIETPEAGAVFQIYHKADGSFDAAPDSERDMADFRRNEDKHLKRRMKHDEYMGFDEELTSVFHPELIEDSLLDTVIHDEELEHLKKAIRQLSPSMQERIILYFFEGLTLPEIAARQGVSSSAVYSTLQYAVKKLKKIW